MSTLDIIDRPVATLTPYTGNPRTHTKRQISQIAESIKTFGWTNPILVDDEGGIIAGHGRVAAAKELGIEMVPTIRLSQMTEAQKRAYIIADNKLAENAGWDESILAIEFEALAELDFDVSVIGFEMGEVDRIISNFVELPDEPDDVTPAVTADNVVTNLGDVWQIGPHRLICGDTTDPETFDRLMLGAKAQMVFTDPPYNVPIAGHVSGLGKKTHQEFAMASGEMSRNEFEAFLKTMATNLAYVSCDGAIHFICMDWRHMHELLSATDGVYTELKNLCVWGKSNGGMGSLYRSQHELVVVFKAGKGRHINNVGLGKHDRNRTNVWTYAGANAFGGTRDGDLEMHPTVKPLELVKDAILDCSNRGGIILDAFAGSGTTLLAAAQTGRKGYGIEIDPAYCDVILKRFVAAGYEPVLEASGQAFSILTKEVEHV